MDVILANIIHQVKCIDINTTKGKISSASQFFYIQDLTIALIK